MAELRLIFLLYLIYLISSDPVVGIDIILGDSFEFVATKDCQKNGAKLTHRLSATETRDVACWDHRDRVWKPGPDYRGRMGAGGSVILKRTNMNDGQGAYELTCDTKDTVIQLHVVVPSEVSVIEEQPVTVPFHHITAGQHGRYITCERHGELIVEFDLSSGETRNGSGFKKGVSVSPAWFVEGNLSVVFEAVQLEDQGDYFFYARDQDGNTSTLLHAVRMTVNKKPPDQITGTRLPVSPTQKAPEGPWKTLAIVALAAVIILIAAVTGLVWWLRSRRPNVSPGPDAAEMGPLNQRDPADPLVNGAPQG